MESVNLAQKLALFTKQWHPHVIAEGDSLQVYLSKIQGEFVMHRHDNGDEFFYVVKGDMEMCFESRTVMVRQGEVILVPRGVAHCPKTDPREEVHVLVIEPLGTTHTGQIHDERTVKEFPRL
ncbi:MAG: cupin domain-containing protein [Candidatus Aminicenantes bacterium]|nr:cupin domain-containing protein [Candidatus Aminicenantes bacterium]